MNEQASAVIQQLDADFDNAVARLQDLLRIKSISTDPDYKGDVRQAAEWCSGQLAEIGFESNVMPTEGHPMVVAHYVPDRWKDGDRSLLYYGHYDVQPPDPLDLWDADPFDPVVIDAERGKRIVARGAVDDKGQLMTFIEAFRAWMKVHGALPCKITVLLEGEEETGSPSLDPFLEQHKDILKADVCMVSDTGMWDIDTPAVTAMLRGLVYVDVKLFGPGHDLHSGMYGGAVVNPNNALATILGDLHDENGVVQIPGFYDNVDERPEAQRAQWDALGFDEDAFLKSAGLDTPHGEANRTTLERIWSRPTCDVNGMWGGYIGKGAKTVIPAYAGAKISCRLVPSQDAERVYRNLVEFLESRTPVGCRWEIHCHGKSPAIEVATDSPFLKAAQKGLTDTYSKEAVLIGCGGSIPVVGSVQHILGFDSLLVGFGLDDDRVHSPNEKFELRCYEMGMKSHAAMLAEMAEV